MDRNSKILTGCGIGCGVVVIIAIVIGVLGYNFIADKITFIGDFEKTMKKLEKKYADYDEYTPQNENLFDEQVMNKFLEIRDSLKIREDEFISAMSTLSAEIEKEEDESDKSTLDMIETGFSTIPEALEFFTYRDHLFDKFDVNAGEYFYYYIMSYYAYLNTDLGDGPLFPIPGNSHGKNFQFDGRQQDDQEKFIREVKESRADEISLRANKFIIKVFNNILASEKIKHKKLIEDELELLRTDKYRIPFDGSENKLLSEFFEQYKEKLNQNYILMLNPLEVNPVKNDRKRRRKADKENDEDGIKFNVEID